MCDVNFLKNLAAATGIACQCLFYVCPGRLCWKVNVLRIPSHPGATSTKTTFGKDSSGGYTSRSVIFGRPSFRNEFTSGLFAVATALESLQA